MLTGVSGKTTHGTRIANVLDVIRIAAEWRKRGIIQIQIEDDEGRSYDPQTFEKIHAHRTYKASAVPSTPRPITLKRLLPVAKVPTAQHSGRLW